MHIRSLIFFYIIHMHCRPVVKKCNPTTEMNDTFWLIAITIQQGCNILLHHSHMQECISVPFYSNQSTPKYRYILICIHRPPVEDRLLKLWVVLSRQVITYWFPLSRQMCLCVGVQWSVLDLLATKCELGSLLICSGDRGYPWLEATCPIFFFLSQTNEVLLDLHLFV